AGGRARVAGDPGDGDRAGRGEELVREPPDPRRKTPQSSRTNACASNSYNLQAAPPERGRLSERPWFIAVSGRKPSNTRKRPMRSIVPPARRVSASLMGTPKRTASRTTCVRCTVSCVRTRSLCSGERPPVVYQVTPTRWRPAAPPSQPSPCAQLAEGGVPNGYIQDAPDRKTGAPVSNEALQSMRASKSSFRKSADARLAVAAADRRTDTRRFPPGCSSR